MVYMEPTALGLEALFKSWEDYAFPPLIPASAKKELHKLLTDLCPSLLYTLRKRCKEISNTVDNGV